MTKLSSSAKRVAVKNTLTRKLQARTAKAIAKHGTFNNVRVAAIQQRKIEKRRIYEGSKGI